MSLPPQFDQDFRHKLDNLFKWRRDVRRFLSTSISGNELQAIIDSTMYAPSVGLSEPWRIVIVEQTIIRRQIYENFLKCNADALSSYRGAQAQHYAQLKLEGLCSAPVQLAIFNDDSTKQGHRLGRRTMPETLVYSTIMAIHTMWLSARARNIGLGWVSILDPSAISLILDIPSTWRFIAYLCLGYPEHESHQPALEREGWQQRETSQRRILYR